MWRGWLDGLRRNELSPVEQPSRMTMRCIVADCTQELPMNLRYKLRVSGIPKKEMLQNWDVIINILNYITRHEKDILYVTSKQAKQLKKRDCVRNRSGVTEPVLVATEKQLIHLSNPKRAYKFIENLGQGGFGVVYYAEKLTHSKIDFTSSVSKNRTPPTSPRTHNLNDEQSIATSKSTQITELSQREPEVYCSSIEFPATAAYVLPVGTSSLSNRSSFDSIEKETENSNSDKSGRFVAIKRVAHTTVRQTWNNLAEVHLMGRVKGHPNVVEFLAAHIVGVECWIVMEFLEGGTLSSLHGYQFTEEQIAYLAYHTLKGLAFLHHNNIVHRDLTNSNIFITKEADIKIIDFGLSFDNSPCKRDKDPDADTELETQLEQQPTDKELDTKKPVTNAKGMMGMKAWMAPEMIAGKYYGMPIDIWAVGVNMLTLANRRPPKKVGNSIHFLFKVATKGHEVLFLRPSVWSKNFHSFVESMLVVDPSQRATAEDLLKNSWLDNLASQEEMKKVAMPASAFSSLNTYGF